MSYQQAASSLEFQELWERRMAGIDKEDRLEALESLEILSLDQEGHWKYSNAFMAWIFEEK